MAEDEARGRLEHYLGGPLRPGRGRRVPSRAHAGYGRRATLEEAVPGYAVRVPEWGEAYKVMTPAADAALRAACLTAFASPDSPTQQRLRARCRETARLDDVLFFDLETTGLGQTPLFLIGVMSWEGEDFLLRQFLARDYGEEAAVLRLFVEMAAEKTHLISFNGKSFDLPQVFQRAEWHGLPCILHAHHFDLLHECRRVWSKDLPNCQLQTLATHICGHAPRTSDIPSAEIPAAYDAFLRNGNATPLALILRHNRLDLLAMAGLLAALPGLD